MMPPFVRTAVGDVIKLANYRGEGADQIKAETLSSGEAIILTKDEEDKARIFAILRDSGVAFSFGKEWSPSELFQYYRDQGWLTGPYQEIAWQGPDRFVIREK